MADQIAAHVTLTYPAEVPSVAELTERVAAAAAATSPFLLRLGAVAYVGSPENVVYIEISDPDGGWLDLRRRIGATGELLEVAPHLTVVHPRTSGAGPSAWADLAGTSVAGEMIATEVAVTAFDGRRWQTLSRFELVRDQRVQIEP
jgi:2'-5' RNA ligase